METKTIWELQYLFQACWLGIRCGILYDGMCLFRILIPHKSWLEGIEDFFFWIACCLFTFLLMFEKNSGVVRGYILLAVLGSMGIWYFIPGRILSRYLGCAIRKGKKNVKSLCGDLKKHLPTFKMKEKCMVRGKLDGKGKQNIGKRKKEKKKENKKNSETKK